MSEDSTVEHEDFAADTLEVDSVFVVFLKDGVPQATNGVRDVIITGEDGNALLLEPAGQTDPETMWRASVEVADDIRRMRDTQVIVQNVIQNMIAFSQQMAEAQRNAQIAQKAGLHVPGKH